MIGLLKSVVVELLKRSSNPKAQEAAKWIKDAEAAAIGTILDLISGDMREKGTISDATVARIEQSAKGHGGSQAQAKSFLDAYQQFLAGIVAVGSLRKALYLDGFLHSADCCSLWLFESDETPQILVSELPTERAIVFSDGRVKIFIDARKDKAELKRQNFAIGNNYTAWRKAVKESALVGVHSIQEDTVNVTKTVKRKKKGRRGLEEIEVSEEDVLQFSDRQAGAQAMADSLPDALMSRDEALLDLKKRIDVE